MSYKRVRRWTIPVFAAESDPADATPYYFGSNPNIPLQASTGATDYRTDKAAIIRAAFIRSYAATVAGSAEDWTLQIHTTTGTETIATHSANIAIRTWYNANMNFALTEGQFFRIESLGVNWAINPEGVSFGGYLILEG